MGFDWRTLPAAEMESHFNPRAAVPDAQARIDAFSARSRTLRDTFPGRYDLRYGDGPKETLDVHAPQDADGSNPLVLFLHGGYWRALDKDDHVFVAPPLVAAGAVVANVNYDLCPDVTLDTIVDEAARALAYCHANAASWGADPHAIHVIGHSAGAHLAATLLLREWPPRTLPAGALRSVIALTGVYEPEVVLSVSVNEEARIGADSAARQTCLGRPFHLRPRMLIAVGGDEPTGWQAQSAAFAGACRDAGLETRFETAPGADHFTLLERALEPSDPLGGAVRAIVA
jgi:arylformamidase